MSLKQIYPGVNLRSPLIIFYLIFFVAYFFAFVFFAFIVPVWWIKVVLLVLSLASPLTILYSTTTKVIISSDNLSKKTFMGTKTLRFKDVKKYGVYLQGPKWAELISSTDISRKFILEIKVIYITSNSDYNPITSFKQRGSLRFHYTKELFNTIKQRLEENNNQVTTE